ncbi:MAG: hypothetical protein KatS3mg024_1991 [Armatimonadota bacterium]|nr:MAG: hypothetical protein KatS3mg024_1991 [Armatimonadota bacterium]
MNQQPFKICPECGQAADLQAPVCAQCGHAYRTQFTPTGQRVATPESSDGRTQMGQPWVAPQQQRFSGVTAAIVGSLAVVAFLILLVVIASVPRTPSQQEVATPQESPAPALTSSGIFEERPSNVETPTIRIYTDYPGGAVLILTGTDGSRYTVACYPNRDGVIQVPAGDYGVEVCSPDGSIPPRTGTAVFRRFTEYEAGFTVITHPAGEELPPLRLGDE